MAAIYIAFGIASSSAISQNDKCRFLLMSSLVHFYRQGIYLLFDIFAQLFFTDGVGVPSRINALSDMIYFSSTFRCTK